MKHSCEIILNLDQWLQEVMLFKEKSLHTTDDERPITIAHLEPLAQVS